MQTSPSEIQKIVRSGGSKGNLMVALVEARKRAENQQNEKILQASLQEDPRTIAQQFEDENNQATTNEVVRGVGGVLAQRKKRADNNLQKVRSQGIAKAPIKRPMMAAQGGIVGYANGNMVESEEEKIRKQREAIEKAKSPGANPFAGFLNRFGNVVEGAKNIPKNIAEGSGALLKAKEAKKEAEKQQQNLLIPKQDTATLDAMSQAPVAPVGGIAAVAPAQTTPVQATTKIEEVPKGGIAAAPKQKVETETDPFKTKEYQDWFDVFIQTLGAKDGQYAKAYIEAKTKLSDRDKAAAQQVIDNENTKADLDIKRLTAENTKMYQEQIVAGRALASLQDDLQKLITESLKLEERLGVQYDLPILQSKLQDEKDKDKSKLAKVGFGTSPEKIKKIQADIDAAKEAMQLEIKSTKSGRDLLSSILGIQNAIRSFETTLGIPSINPAPAPAIQDGFGELKIR